mmetsp:Transcript_25099/g.59819  ORF Transcript_25099/g.59819 Transcript_25099/m.59819 type:complete len:297 (+) Transcript_25099:583-1473(+)
MPDVDHVVPPSAGQEAVCQHAPVQPHRKLSVVVKPPREPVLGRGGCLPQADGHVIRARRELPLAVRRPHQPPDRVRVPLEDLKLALGAADVPDFDALVHRPGGDDGFLIFVPVGCQHLELVRSDAEDGGPLPNIPDLGRAVARGAEERVPVPRAPDSAVDAVGVPGVGLDRRRPREAPELDGVVPRRAHKRVPPHVVPVHPVHLVCVLLQRSQGIGLWWARNIPNLQTAVPAGRYEHIGIVLAPCTVKQTVESVILGQCFKTVGACLEHVLLPVANYSKVLSRSNSNFSIVKRTEL